MERTWTTWFEIDVESQEEAEQIFKTMMNDDDFSPYEEELSQQNITSENYKLYKNLDFIKRIKWNSM